MFDRLLPHKCDGVQIKEAHAEMGSWLNAAKGQDAELKKRSTAKLDLPPVRGSQASDKRMLFVFVCCCADVVVCSQGQCEAVV